LSIAFDSVFAERSGSAENWKTKMKSERRARSRLVEGREKLRMAHRECEGKRSEGERKIKVAIGLFQEVKRAEGTTIRRWVSS
jgi:hypothetical protein